MQPQTVEVWRKVKAAGAAGIDMAALKAAMPGCADVSKRVTNLRGMGYIKPLTDAKHPHYVVTTKVPAAALEDDDAEADDTATEAEWKATVRSKTPQGVPPGVPNSVFHLGQMHGAEAGAPVLGERPRTLIGEEGEILIPVLRPPKSAATEAPAPAPEPRFELHSDGVLLIDPAGDGTEPIALQPSVTRRLFRWLDQLGGLQLTRLVEQGAEARS